MSSLPMPTAESDKYRRGVVGVVAGSTGYTGAALLATGGALRTGAGMVRFVSVAHPAELVRARWPEAVVTVLKDGRTSMCWAPVACRRGSSGRASEPTRSRSGSSRRCCRRRCRWSSTLMR